MRTGLQWDALLGALALGLFLLGYGLSTSERQPFQPSERGGDVLRAVTWNVGSSTHEGDSTLRNEYIKHVASVLRQLDPEICFLQEIANKKQWRTVLSTLGGSWEGHLGRPRLGRRTAIVVQRGTLGRMRLRGVKSFITTSRYESHRFGSVAALSIHAATFSSKARNEEIGSACDALRKHAAQVPQIFAGDLNLDMEVDKRRDLFSDNEYLDVETYNYVAKALLDTARGAGSTAEPDRRLDYIFVDPEFFSLVDAGPWKGHRVGDMDHDPVIADLRLMR